MVFIPLHYPDKIKVVNPLGDVGILTLWSPVDVVVRHLEMVDIDLNPKTSRIAAIGTLYGNGIPGLLRNLLHNPQIRNLCLFGKDLGTSRRDILNFFESGIDPVDFLGAETFCIRNTKHIIDGNVDATDFEYLTVTDFGSPKDFRPPAQTKQIQDAMTREVLPAIQERKDVPIPQIQTQTFPSNVLSHSISSSTPLRAWEEVVSRIYRFGQKTELKKGSRYELLNLKVVINHATVDQISDLEEHGFDLDALFEYQDTLLSGDIPAEHKYSYGNRIRAYYPVENPDALQTVIEKLRKDRESRKCYISLWDTANDLFKGVSSPCLVSLFFRVHDNRLTLTATFRTHNALDGWLRNVYGLMAIQQHVGEALDIHTGTITVISQSITLDPANGGMSRAKAISEKFLADQQDPLKFDKDPCGDFHVTTDDTEIVVEHRWQGQLVSEFRGEKAEDIERELAAKYSELHTVHAMYIGRQLAIAERRLRSGKRQRGKSDAE